ncbi:Zeaxanthin glucosyl transferase [Alloactinosynnema sp. L-07]|uniref:glycosyltransferase n=1 Tax=Alloactinosynnema sp. L-07 TaxID=1653480 RepID=UPI00065EF757|nr:glycosyltransferase [Alloactinosynnema sp. L-07]CRK56363.1 Zeaxanthin glucosyl transferase [Alloactinosynnema sp. L-07]
MSRFLLVVPPLVGHVLPLLGVASALTERGHEVAWAGAGGWLRSIAPDHAVFDCGIDAFASDAQRPPDLRGASALKFLVQDYLVPLAEAMLPAVTVAIERFRPDVVVADQQTYAGALAADRLGLPWATSASTSAELSDPFSPKVGQWVIDQLDRLRDRSGATADPRFSEQLILAFTTPELTGPLSTVARPVRFVGPILDGRAPAKWTPPWPDSDVPTVFVSLGTANANAGARFLTECAKALSRRDDLRAVIVDPAGHLGPQPPTINVAPFVPQLAVLAHTALVVCHAGHNTVVEALWHGLPLVVAPIRDDQQVIAGQVVEAGAGVRLRFTRASAEDIADAVDAALAKPEYAQAARRIQTSFHSGGGAVAAAGLLEELIR